ncbi:hypothetical protein EJ03DRAFT_22606 [Teratosphaeria nubilosa]|uniref:Uncharacterized protein n=1 Tax=Teratosphaeria nubilosa TaxID=161662 RepID=A0A6G1LGH3_9PEZI|nr:hypothetical protein EJ03DRAFT_22606 [Teratosphaeria nubilosa]
MQHTYMDSHRLYDLAHESSVSSASFAYGIHAGEDRQMAQCPEMAFLWKRIHAHEQYGLHLRPGHDRGGSFGAGSGP